MDDRDRDRLATEAYERAGAMRNASRVLELEESAYVEVESFMKDLIEWAGDPSKSRRVEEQAYRYFHLLAANRTQQPVDRRGLAGDLPT